MGRRLRLLAGAALAGWLGAAAAQEPPTCELLAYYPFDWSTAAFNGICTSHGVCTDDGCKCDEGWTGRSDFINTEGFECHVFEPAVDGLWALLLVVALYGGIKDVPRIKIRYQQYRKTKMERLARGYSHPMWRNRGLMSVLTYHLIGFPSIVAMCILKLVNKEERVGITPGATILFILVKIGFYLAVFFFQPALLASILEGSKRDLDVKPIIRMSNLSAFTSLFLSVTCGFAPLITLVHGGEPDNVAKGVYLGYMGGTVFTFVFYGFQSYILLVMSNAMFKKSHLLTNDDRLLRLKEAMTATQKEGIRQCTVQGVIYSTFMLWPFLYNKHDYFLPIGWIALPLIMKNIAHTAIGQQVRQEIHGSSQTTGATNSPVAPSSGKPDFTAYFSRVGDEPSSSKESSKESLEESFGAPPPSPRMPTLQKVGSFTRSVTGSITESISSGITRMRGDSDTSWKEDLDRRRNKPIRFD